MTSLLDVDSAATPRCPAPPARATRLPEPVELWGLPLVPVTLGEVLDEVDRWVADPARRPRFVITPNLNYAMLARRDFRLVALAHEASLVLADGMPLVWGARLRGRPLPGRVAGSDLMPAVCARAAERGYSIFLLGGAPGVAEQAAEALRAKHPGIRVVGTATPPYRPMTPEENSEIVGRVRDAAPDLLFVAMSQPKGDVWLAENYRAMGVPAAFQVGAAIDFVAGRIARAPRWVGRSGLEWAFRLALEPRRLGGRYARNAAFLARALGADLLRAAADRLSGAR